MADQIPRLAHAGAMHLELQRILSKAAAVNSTAPNFHVWSLQIRELIEREVEIFHEILRRVDVIGETVDSLYQRYLMDGQGQNGRN